MAKCLADIMPGPGLSERLLAEWRLLPFIRSTICPEANSNVKREMAIFGGSALKANRHSRRRSPPPLFPNCLQFPANNGPATATRVLRQSEGQLFAHYRSGSSEVSGDYNNSHL